MNAPVHSMLTVREIEEKLRAVAESIVKHCLPNAVKDGMFMRIGDIRGDVSRHGPGGGSLMIGMTGAGRGMWTDFASGESGDMLDMIAITRYGGNKGEAVAWAKSTLGLDDLDPGRLATMRAETQARDTTAQQDAEREAENKKRGARALWLKGAHLSGTCPASHYLTNRGIDVARLGKWPGSLLFCDEVWSSDAKVKLPAMLATMVLPNGMQVATHRTYLGRQPETRAWVKADAADLGVPVGNAKKILGKSHGAFVPLRKGASGVSMSTLKHPETIYLTEGIEDGLTVAMAMPQVRVGVAYSLHNIGVIEFPPLIETIVIVADRDDGQREVEALERAIARQQARGHKVQIVMPPVGVKDVNAWLNSSPAPEGKAA